jgi:hypothetical protein
MRRFVRALDVIPRGYGVAYRAWDRDGAVCYPIPLNWLVRWARGAMIWLRFPERATRYEAANRAAYDRGYVAGGAYALLALSDDRAKRAP